MDMDTARLPHDCPAGMFNGAVCCKGPRRKENRHGVRGWVRPVCLAAVAGHGQEIALLGVDGVTECDGWNTHISFVAVYFSIASHVRHFLLNSNSPRHFLIGSP